MGEAVGVLTPTMLNGIDNGFLVSEFECRRARLARDFQHLRVDACCLQETRLSTRS